MSSVEISHWVALISSVEKRLDIQVKRRSISRDDLLALKKRLNGLVEATLWHYRSFPPDLEHDLNKLVVRLDRAFVAVGSPEFEAIIEVPAFEDEPKVTRRRVIKRRPFQFIWPVTKMRVSSPFGFRRDPYTKQRRFHDGIDLAGNRGDIIYASEQGKVIFTGYKGKAGKLVILRHQGGLKSFYAHLSEILTVRGVTVQRGQPIGLMGSTGRSTGPHLHFKISQNNKSINPDSIVGQVF